MVHAKSLLLDTEDGKTISALVKVYDHKLWSRVYFWQDALLVGLAEAHLQEFGRSLAQGPEAEVPESAPAPVVVTSFLKNYVGFMVALGIKQEAARASLLKSLQENATFLGAPMAEAYFRAMTGDAGGAGEGAA